MIVIDASAAAGIAREGEESPAAAFLVGRNDKVIAPELFAVEAAQVAWKYAHIGALGEDGAAAMARTMLACVDELQDNGTLANEALAEAIRLDHPFYDMLYFVLARRTSALLLTCDHRLASLCEANNVECVQLVDL